MSENQKYLNAAQVCSILGVGEVTLATWYKFYNSIPEEDRKNIPPLPDPLKEINVVKSYGAKRILNK